MPPRCAVVTWARNRDTLEWLSSSGNIHSRSVTQSNHHSIASLCLFRQSSIYLFRACSEGLDAEPFFNYCLAARRTQRIITNKPRTPITVVAPSYLDITDGVGEARSESSHPCQHGAVDQRSPPEARKRPNESAFIVTVLRCCKGSSGGGPGKLRFLWLPLVSQHERPNARNVPPDPLAAETERWRSRSQGTSCENPSAHASPSAQLCFVNRVYGNPNPGTLYRTIRTVILKKETQGSVWHKPCVLNVRCVEWRIVFILGVFVRQPVCVREARR